MDTKASLQLTAASAIWGFSWLCGRVIASDGIDPVTASAARFLVGSAGLLAIMLVHRPWPRLSGRVLLGASLMGLFGVVLYNVCFFNGLRTVPAGRASLVASLQPALVFAASAMLWRERVRNTAVIGLSLSFLGAGLMLSRGSLSRLMGEGLNRGDLWILGCAGCWAVYSLIGRVVMRSVPALAATAYSTWLGTLMLLAPGFEAVTGWSVKVWASVLFLGIVGTTAAFLLYLGGLRRVGPSRASIFLSLVPLFGVLFSSIILNERLDGTAALGGACAIAGIYLMNR